jgi:hypothetical protein
MESKDTIRFWAGALGAMALVAAIVAVVVMVRTPPPKSPKAAAPATTKPAQTAKSTAPVAKPAPPVTKPSAPVSSATPPPTAKPAPAVAKAAPQTTVAAKAPAPAPAKPQPQPQPQPTATAAAKPAPAATKPLTDAERKLSEDLWVEQKKVDTASARMTSTSDGRRRVAETIAKQFNVPDKVVSDLRGRNLGYGEMVSTLAFSQQLMKHDKITRQQAIDKIVAARKMGQGWAAYARAAGIKIGDVLADVRTADKQLSKLVMVKAER